MRLEEKFDEVPLVEESACGLCAGAMGDIRRLVRHVFLDIIFETIVNDGGEAAERSDHASADPVGRSVHAT
jgi:hypothetical protein